MADSTFSDQEKELMLLEKVRKDLFKKIAKIGDMRCGTISVNFRKCGHKNCSCAKPGNPKHGPQYLWNTTRQGKSYAKNLKLGPELQKYKQETDSYRLFMQIQNEILDCNEKICQLRPMAISSENETEILKKKLKKYFSQKYKRK